MPYTQSMAEPLTTDDIFDPKNLPQEVPESNDLLIFRDISESAPNTIMKVCTPAQAIIDDTTPSDKKSYSSSMLENTFLKYVKGKYEYTNVDLNTIVEPGIYSVRYNTGSGYNFPSGNSGVLIVIPSSENTDRVKQIFTRIGTTAVSDNHHFIRQIDTRNSTYGEWARIITNDYLFYGNGETITSGAADSHYYFLVPTIVTSATTSIRGTLILPKQYSGRKQITCTKLSGYIRSSTGGYIPSSSEIDFANSDDYTVLSYIFDNKILFFINKTTGKWTQSDGSEIINNSSQVFEIRSYEFTV